MAYVKKTSYFKVAPPGYTIAYKNVDNLLKNGMNYVVQGMFKF